MNDFDPPGLHVDQERYLLKCNERYAERQNDMHQYEFGAKHIIDRAVKKVGIFEKTEKKHVERDCQQ